MNFPTLDLQFRHLSLKFDFLDFLWEFRKAKDTMIKIKRFFGQADDKVADQVLLFERSVLVLNKKFLKAIYLTQTIFVCLLDLNNFF